MPCSCSPTFVTGTGLPARKAKRNWMECKMCPDAEYRHLDFSSLGMDVSFVSGVPRNRSMRGGFSSGGTVSERGCGRRQRQILPPSVIPGVAS